MGWNVLSYQTLRILAILHVVVNDMPNEERFETYERLTLFVALGGRGSKLACTLGQLAGLTKGSSPRHRGGGDPNWRSQSSTDPFQRDIPLSAQSCTGGRSILLEHRPYSGRLRFFTTVVECDLERARSIALWEIQVETIDQAAHSEKVCQNVNVTGPCYERVC
jgi:hypothetical protein